VTRMKPPLTSRSYLLKRTDQETAVGTLACWWKITPTISGIALLNSRSPRLPRALTWASPKELEAPKPISQGEVSRALGTAPRTSATSAF